MEKCEKEKIRPNKKREKCKWGFLPTPNIRNLERVIVLKDGINTKLLSQIEISNDAQQGLLDTLVEKDIQHLEENKLLQVRILTF